MITHSQETNIVDLLNIVKAKKNYPIFPKFTLRNFGYVTNDIKAQVETLGPLWEKHKSEGTSWIK